MIMKAKQKKSPQEFYQLHKNSFAKWLISIAEKNTNTQNLAWWVKSNYMVIYFRMDKTCGLFFHSFWRWYCNKAKHSFSYDRSKSVTCEWIKAFYLYCRLLKRQQVHNHVDMTHHKYGYWTTKSKKKEKTAPQRQRIKSEKHCSALHGWIVWVVSNMWFLFQ